MNKVSGQVAMWRLLVAVVAATGVVLAAREYAVWWTALSQLASIAVAVSFVALAVVEPRSPWLRGALATLMLLVALAYLPMANGNLAEPWSVLEHMVTPALVVVDLLFVGTNQAGLRWWHPLTWVIAPAAYAVWYVAGDLQVYAALDPHRPTVFAGQLVVLFALLLMSGFGVYAVGAQRRRGSLAS